MTELSPASRKRSRPGWAGATIIELLVTLAILTVIAGFAYPAFRPLLTRRSLDASAAFMAGEFGRVRHEALARKKYVGIVFDRSSGRDQYSVYLDGGQRGIRAAEVRSGMDTLLRGPEDIGARFPGVRLGIPLLIPLRKVPPSRGVLPRGGDPVRFGSSDIVSFSPTGEASSGSLYLMSGEQEVRSVVLYGRTGRIRVWKYFPEIHLWRQ